jgi:hypothetical protein
MKLAGQSLRAIAAELDRQELEQQALDRGLGQECDDTPRLPDNRARVMTHPRDAKGCFVRRIVSR